jgi:hypothetical protein
MNHTKEIWKYTPADTLPDLQSISTSKNVAKMSIQMIFSRQKFQQMKHN